MSVNFSGGYHHIYSNIVPVSPAAKPKPQASPEDSKRWLEDLTSNKPDSNLAMGGAHNALSMLKWMESSRDK